MEGSDNNELAPEAGFQHGKTLKLKELLHFQAKERTNFIQSQINFYTAFVNTVE